MKIISVSQRIDKVNDRDEVRDALDQRLVSFLRSIGSMPVPIPNSLDDSGLRSFLETVSPDGFVLSGGNNIGEWDKRDTTESTVVGFAREKKLPILGICRGMQMLGVLAGTNLIRKSGHVNSRHDLVGEIRHNVNSYHEYSLENCPKDYDVLAVSEDGTIKAIKHHDLPWEGWMWHPEREHCFSSEDRQRARKLFKII